MSRLAEARNTQQEGFVALPLPQVRRKAQLSKAILRLRSLFTGRFVFHCFNCGLINQYFLPE